MIPPGFGRADIKIQVSLNSLMFALQIDSKLYIYLFPSPSK